MTISSFRDIHGWFDFEELYHHVIKNAPDDKEFNFLEIGTWLGKSACFAGQMAKLYNKPIKIWTVDTFKGGADGEFYKQTILENGGTIKHITQKHVDDLQLGDIITLVESLSTECLSKINVEAYDFIFIDGSHDYSSVLNDIEYLWPALRAGGMMAGHDFNLESVYEAVYFFVKSKKIRNPEYNISQHCWMLTKNV